MSSGNSYLYIYPHRMVRWGSNGLAFHTAAGVFSIESNLVKDLSSTVADLRVAVSASGGTTTGTQTSYTVTVTNSGPSDATDVALALQVPSTGVLVSASTTRGTCSTSTSGCSFGTLTNGSTATVTIHVLQTSAGTATLNAQVSGSTADNVTSNNSGAASVTVTGGNYNLAPTLSSVTPAAIRAGSADTTITVVGTNFTAGSTVLLGSTVLNTSYTSATQPHCYGPCGKCEQPWVFVYLRGRSVAGRGNIELGATDGVQRHLARREPYCIRRVQPQADGNRVDGSSTVAANSLVAITPETATVGTPVALTAQPTKLTFSPTGQTLWVALNNTQSIVRYDMLTGATDTIAIPNPSNYLSYYVPYATEIAVQPGTEHACRVSG